MKKHIFRGRRARYSGMSAVITALMLIAVVLLNTLFTMLSDRYKLQIDLRADLPFSVSRECYDLLGTVLGQEDEVTVVFCDTEKNLKASTDSKYIYQTAIELAERFPEKIKLQFVDIWLNPQAVRKYTKSTDPVSGEEIQTTLKTSSVIVTSGDFYRVYAQEEFFAINSGNGEAWAYNGEKKLASAILRAVAKDRPTVCFTNNHGETFYDPEILYLFDDAGYDIRHVDLLTDGIPEGCNLIVTYNPNMDLIDRDGVSDKSETAFLENFLSVSGNSYLVFLQNSTPSLPTLEGFLADWGVETRYATVGSAGATYRYTVQDTTQSLTADGYSIYGEPVQTGKSAQLLAGLGRKTVFANATALRATFRSNGDGSYTRDNRTVYSLYQSGKHAVSWASGSPVDGGETLLFALTEQKNADAGSSFVGVCSSVGFATEGYLQSAVYGNTDAVMRALKTVGAQNLPEGLALKPFLSTTISAVTTAQMWGWTLALTLVPVAIVTTTAVLILVRRRNR